ncbi:MAG: hypothetical protein GQ477_04340, partial [Nanohaloarchaea archaeon]|nr:hypothetical protein [Candidatus Nanohaloarchaea archaeon]
PSLRIREYNGTDYFDIGGDWNLTAYNSNGSVPNATLTLTNTSANYIWRTSQKYNESNYGDYSFTANITGKSAVLMTNISDENIYNYYVFDITPPSITYNPNTDNGTVYRNWIIINITASDNNKDTVLLEWQGANETFDNNDGNVYWENKTDLDHGYYTFKAYVNDSAGNINQTQERTVFAYVTCNIVCSGGGSLSDTCYINDSQSVSGCIINGSNLVLQSGGDLTSSAGNAFILNMSGNITIESYGKITGNVNITASNLTIETNGEINLNGKGYARGATGTDGSGPGAGIYGYYCGTGAGHAGYGSNGFQNGNTGDTYDLLTDPQAMGSGGAGAGEGTVGGAGGGLIRLNISGILAVNGSIKADGNGGSGSLNCGGGGGSGGSIFIEAETVAGNGTIQANGGNRGGSRGGGGGGGRIAIYYTANTSAWSIQTYGGIGHSSAGGAGTVYLKHADQPNFNLVIDNNGNSGLRTPISNGTDDTWTIDNLTIKNYGILTNSPDTGGLGITATNIDITSDGSLDVSGSGYAGGAAGSAGTGPGAGNPASYGGTGAGHAGYGGNAYSNSNGGDPYGSLTNTQAMGSGGAGAGEGTVGGAGGGLIRLNISGILTVNGSIKADGNGGSGSLNCGGGGGSGGSIFIEAETIAGNGTIQANGGNHGGSRGGAGSGGRISIYCTTDISTITTYAYSENGYSTDGGAGTIYQKSQSQTYGDLRVDNNGINGKTTPLNSSAYSTAFDTMTVQSGAVVSSALATLPLNTTTLKGDGTISMSSNNLVLRTTNISMDGGSITSTSGQINITAPNSIYLNSTISTSTGTIKVWYGSTGTDRCHASSAIITGTNYYYFSLWSNITPHRCIESIVLDNFSLINESNATRTEFNTGEPFYPSLRIREYNGTDYFDIGGYWNMTTYNSNGSVPNTTFTLTNTSANYIWRISQKYNESTSGNYTFMANFTGKSAVLMTKTSFENNYSYVVVDGTPPQIYFIFPTPDNNSYINNNYIFINWFLTDANQDTTIFSWNGTTNTTTSNTYFNQTNLADGTYTYYVWANNSAGNQNQSETRTLTIDNTPPIIIVNSPTDTDYHTKDIQLNIDASDSVTPITECTYSLDGNADTPIAKDTGTTYSKQLFNLEIGTHNITFTCTNAANLQTITETIYFNITFGEVTIRLEDSGFIPVIDTEDHYIASDLPQGTVTGLIHVDGNFKDVSSDSDSISLSNSIGSEVYLVYTKGTTDNIEDRTEYIRSGEFEKMPNPSFGFPITKKYKIYVGLEYDNIDISGKDLLHDGLYNIIFRNSGDLNNKNIVDIRLK